MRKHRYEYDVALSFAGEDRTAAEQLAERLKGEGISVFYDDYEQARLWGKDLYVHLHEVYGSRARFCVMFISEHYSRKVWTTHERQAAQERALQEKGRDYILPVRIDSTDLPGLSRNIGYVPISVGTDRLARLVIDKINDSNRANN
jgi:hypothetical protein